MTAVPGEQFGTVGDVRLCYETFGDPSDPCLLLVMGLGMQMIAWDDEFCDRLARQGFQVVRFDNRDCGRSTHLNHLPAPSPARLAVRAVSAAAYTLADMASDAMGLLDHLGVDAAHVVGISMGAMIAQTIAAQQGSRTLSLASIMGSTGSLRDGQPSPRIWPMLLRRAPETKTAYVEHLTRLFGTVGSPAYPTDEDVRRALFSANFDRGAIPAGTARQLAAVFASGNRRSDLRTVTAPTLVMHGTADRLVRPSGALATSRAIAHSRLVLIEGLGHDLPRALWPVVIEEITSNTRRAAHRALVR